MFPLGTNLFPGELLPLHVFEERYRRFMDDLLAGVADDSPQGSHAIDDRASPPEAPSFGVVLIERGRETGGGDVRADVATRAVLRRAERFADGRWAIVAEGIERLDVDAWLPDDPYPLAIVSTRVRSDTGGGSLEAVRTQLERALALVAELTGAELPTTGPVGSDPLATLDRMSALAPLGTFDRQTILAARTTDEQIELLGEALSERLVLLENERAARDSE